MAPWGSLRFLLDKLHSLSAKKKKNKYLRGTLQPVLLPGVNQGGNGFKWLK